MELNELLSFRLQFGIITILLLLIEQGPTTRKKPGIVSLGKISAKEKLCFPGNRSNFLLIYSYVSSLILFL